jgi:hypothetical protein
VLRATLGLAAGAPAAELLEVFYGNDLPPLIDRGSSRASELTWDGGPNPAVTPRP